MLSVTSRLSLWRKTALVAMTAAWLTAVYVVFLDQDIRNELYAFLSHYPEIAPFVLVGCQLVFASFVLPCSPLTVLAGLLWGFHAGIVYSIIATVAGSLWTFVLGRWVLKRWVSLEDVSPLLAYGVFQKIDTLITRYTWRASAIAHANPALPGSSLGYAFGATDVSLISYASGAVLGILPLQVILVGLGHALGQSSTMPTVHIAVALSGILVVFMLYRA